MIDRILNYQISLFSFQFSGKNIIKNPLFSGSAIMILGSNLSNLIAYIYHLIIGRILGPSQYGTLAALLSLMGLVAVSFGFLGTVIVKFVSAAEKEETVSLYQWFTKKIYLIGIVLFFLMALAAPLLSNFLHIEVSTLILLAPMFLFTVIVYYYRSFLQGLLRFKEVVISTNLDMLGKLVLGVTFIYFGYSVFGAVAAIVLSILFSGLILRYFLREYINHKSVKVFKGGKRIFAYTVPVIVTSLSTQLFFSTDVLLVKHFFSSHDAGIFAALSTLGKIIFFAAAPIVVVMFPMISKRHAKKQGHDKILFMSIAMTAGLAFAITFIYYLLPELMIKILYGSKFIEAAQNLYLFGIFMTIFSLSSLLLSYYLSKEDTRIVYLALFVAILQGVGIWFYHNSIFQVVMVNIITISVLFISLLIYFIYDKKTKVK